MAKYTLTAINQSTNPTNFAVFQQDPDIGVENVFSLAWFSKYAYPNTTITFEWEIKYNFVWSETGVLRPGIIFHASQSPQADLQANNQISLDYDPEQRAYYFQPEQPITAPPLGTLRVVQSGKIPLKQASVGIGMSGYGTFVVDAQPNLTVNFTPHPKYYIVAGNFSQGQVLDIAQVTNAVEVPFAPNVYQMTAILNKDNSWNVKNTAKLAEFFINFHNQK